MKKSYIFARRITAGRAGSPLGWDGVDDFVSWYVKNKSATSQKAALKLLYKNAVDRSEGRMHGLIVELEGSALTEMWGFRGANISVYLPSNATLKGSQVNVGLHVEVQGGASPITGDWYGAYIYSAPGASPSGDACVLRLEALAAADAGNKTWLEFIGGKGERAMSFGPLATQTAWAYTGTPTNIQGWVKVRVGPNFDRWIALYETGP